MNSRQQITPFLWFDGEADQAPKSPRVMEALLEMTQQAAKAT